MSILDEVAELGVPPLPVKAVTAETKPETHAQWAKFRPMFEAAMKDGLHDIVALERNLAQGKAILFPGKESAVIAEKVTYASGVSVFQCTWAVGDLEEILGMAPGIEAIGRSMGCERMLIEGHKGWERILKGRGYEFFSVTLVKGL